MSRKQTDDIFVLPGDDDEEEQEEIDDEEETEHDIIKDEINPFLNNAGYRDPGCIESKLDSHGSKKYMPHPSFITRKLVDDKDKGFRPPHLSHNNNQIPPSLPVMPDVRFTHRVREKTVRFALQQKYATALLKADKPYFSLKYDDDTMCQCLFACSAKKLKCKHAALICGIELKSKIVDCFAPNLPSLGCLLVSDSCHFPNDTTDKKEQIWVHRNIFDPSGLNNVTSGKRATPWHSFFIDRNETSEPNQTLYAIEKNNFLLSDAMKYQEALVGPHIGQTQADGKCAVYPQRPSFFTAFLHKSYSEDSCTDPKEFRLIDLPSGQSRNHEPLWYLESSLMQEYRARWYKQVRRAHAVIYHRGMTGLELQLYPMDDINKWNNEINVIMKNVNNQNSAFRICLTFSITYLILF